MPNRRWYEAYRSHAKEEVSGELKGPCPHCGGDDRFFIKPDGSFGCRNADCSPGKSNPETYKAIVHKLDQWSGLNGSADQKWEKIRQHVFVGPDGQPHIRHIKWKAGRNKFPWSWQIWDGEKWSNAKGKFQLNDLLYNRQYLTESTKTVILLEGEKDCDVFHELFKDSAPRIVAVSGGGGAGNPYLDWQALRHVKELYILFDADVSGRAGVQTYGQKAVKELPNVDVRVYAAPGNEGTDLADIFATGGKKGVGDWLKAHKQRAVRPEIKHEDNAPQETLLGFLQAAKPPPETLFAELFIAAEQAKDVSEWCYDLIQKQWFRLLPSGRWEASNERFVLTVKEMIESWAESAQQWGQTVYHKIWSKIGGYRYIASVVSVLSEHHNVLHTDGKQWDQDPEMLGTPTGVWCLRELRKLSRTEAGPKMITQASAVEPELDANPQSRWNQFVAELASNDQEEQLFLMQYLGYCLTGYTSERKFLFLKGVTSNGKSVLLDTLKHVLGDYVTVAPRSEFQWRPPSQAGAPTTEVMEFQGRRLVLLDEQEDIRWDVEKLKNIVAGGWLKGRRMRQDPIEFKSYCKLIIASNHNPRFDADEALKSRFLALACRYVPPVPDPLLTKTLEGESAHILGMMMQFAQAWIVDCRSQKEFLPVPKSVIRERDFLMDDADEYRLFLTDECEITSNELHRVSNADLVSAFREWTKDHGMELPETMTDRKITFRLKKAANGVFGLRPYRSGKERGISGIKLGMLATQSSAF